VVLFSWLATLGKILTMDNLRKRHIIVVDWCCICKKSEESVDHLLIHCEMTTFVRYLPREGRLMLDHTTMFLFPMITLFFIG
jgi:hypothetical protein